MCSRDGLLGGSRASREAWRSFWADSGARSAGLQQVKSTQLLRGRAEFERRCCSQDTCWNKCCNSICTVMAADGVVRRHSAEARLASRRHAWDARVGEGKRRADCCLGVAGRWHGCGDHAACATIVGFLAGKRKLLSLLNTALNISQAPDTRAFFGECQRADTPVSRRATPGRLMLNGKSSARRPRLWRPWTWFWRRGAKFSSSSITSSSVHPGPLSRPVSRTTHSPIAPPALHPANSHRTPRLFLIRNRCAHGRDPPLSGPSCWCSETDVLLPSALPCAIHSQSLTVCTSAVNHAQTPEQDAWLTGHRRPGKPKDQPPLYRPRHRRHKLHHRGRRELHPQLQAAAHIVTAPAHQQRWRIPLLVLHPDACQILLPPGYSWLNRYLPNCLFEAATQLPQRPNLD